MLTHLHRRGALARRVFDRLVESRSQQDNEQWHLLTLNDLATRAEAKRSVPPGDPAADRHGLLPPGLAAVRGQTGLELPAQRPLRRPRPNTSTCSTSPNTELEHQPDPGAFAADYGRYAGLADLLRQIGHDERTHKQKASCRPPPPTRRALRTRLKRPYCADSDSGSRHRLPRGAMGALNDERCLL